MITITGGIGMQCNAYPVGQGNVVDAALLLLGIWKHGGQSDTK